MPTTPTSDSGQGHPIGHALAEPSIDLRQTATVHDDDPPRPAVGSYSMEVEAKLLESGLGAIVQVDGVPTFVVDPIFEAARQAALAGFADRDRVDAARRETARRESARRQADRADDAQAPARRTA